MNTISRINPFTMGFIKYNRDQLLKLSAGRPSIQNKETIENLKQFNLFHYRGARGGVDRGLRTWDRNDGVNQMNLKSLPEAISTVNLTSRTNVPIQIKRSRTVKRIKYESFTVVKGQSKIDICNINPRSVKNKTIALNDFIQTNDYEIVAITETWLGTSIDKATLGELLPEGYQIKHVPRVKRPGGYHGGGVALIHKSSIDVSLLDSTNYNEFNTLEYMDCNIKIKNYSLRLV